MKGTDASLGTRRTSRTTKATYTGHRTHTGQPDTKAMAPPLYRRLL